MSVPGFSHTACPSCGNMVGYVLGSEGRDTLVCSGTDGCGARFDPETDEVLHR